jgi:CheY-like chemotaxis protein
MTVQALLCSSDTQSVAAIQRILNTTGIELEVCTHADRGMIRLHEEKFDAVFVDCEMALGTELLRSLRTSPSNKQAIAFALLNGELTTQQAYALGANFALEKPLTLEATSKTLRAAAGLIVRERRRYFRQDVCAETQVWTKTGQRSALLTNLSESGMLLSRVALAPGSKIRFQFTLPWTEVVINGEGHVAWTRGETSGVRIHVTKPQRQTLEDWVQDRAFRDKQFSLQRGAPLMS